MGYGAVTGAWFPQGAAAAERARLTGGLDAARAVRARGMRHSPEVIHPYLGYVFDAGV